MGTLGPFAFSVFLFCHPPIEGRDSLEKRKIHEENICQETRDVYALSSAGLFLTNMGLFVRALCIYHIHSMIYVKRQDVMYVQRHVIYVKRQETGVAICM